MKLCVLYSGRSSPSIDKEVAEYVKRVPKLELVPIRSQPAKTRFQRIIRTVGPKTYLVMLDEGGKQLTSEDFASLLQKWYGMGRDVAFLIGDEDGFSDEDRNAVDFHWSLSKLTFPYSLAKLLLVEQLFRAQTIIQHHPYHRQ